MDPATRKLIRVTIDETSGRDRESRVSGLMGKKTRSLRFQLYQQECEVC